MNQLATAVPLLAALLLAASAFAADTAKWQPGPKAQWPQSSPTPPYVNAADYGVKPARPDKLAVEVFHGNPDATAALQAALDAGAGGRVYIPAGQYRVTRPLIVPTGTTVMGAGHCATMLLTEKPIPGILHLRRVGGPMTLIRDLWVAGPIGGNWGATGIWLDGCNGVTVQDCWVSALGTGIRVDGISDTWLRNIVFELNQHGIEVQCPALSWACGNLRLVDCYGYQNYQTGITLTNCRGVQVQSCSAVGSGHALLAKNCAQVTISGTQVNFDGSPWRKLGIRLEGCDTVTLAASVVEGMVQYGIAAVGCKHLSLSGNVVRNTSDGPGILLQGCELATASSNSVSESAGDGIAVSGCRYLTLMGNVVDSYGTKAKAVTAPTAAPGASDAPSGSDAPPRVRSTHPPAVKEAPAAGIRVDEACMNCELLANLVKPVEGGGPPQVLAHSRKAGK